LRLSLEKTEKSLPGGLLAELERALTRLVLLILVLFILPVPAALAQAVNSSDAAIGIVRDPSGAVVREAVIVVRATGTALERLGESGRDGAFRVPVPQGRYIVSVSAAGFSTTSVEIAVPVQAPIEVQLDPAPVVEQVRVVSASRQEELRETLNTRVDVITRARLEDTGAETVGEVLREVPGVVTRRGSETAGAAGEQIQGIDSRQVLVLMDGQPLVGARGIKRGALNLDRQATSRLERVEVVKGAASALYGSDAIGGVINLITRESDAPMEINGALSAGSLDERNARAEAGFRRDAWSGLVGVEHHQQDGFDLTPSTFDTTGAPFERVDLISKTRYRFSPALSASALVNGYHNRTTGRSNGELGPQEDEIVDVAINGGVSIDWLPRPTTSVQARAYGASYEEDSTARLAPPASTSLEPGALDQRLAKVDASISQFIGARQQAQAGFEWWNDRYDGINRLRDDGGHSATTVVGWAQHRVSMTDRIVTTVGARIDHHSAFGTAVSPKVAASARVGHGVHVRASYGRGFRAPDLGQLYYRFLNPTNFYQVIGNPNLDPEYADSIQLGAEYTSANRRGRLGVNVFRNDVEDLIESQSLGFVATPAQLAAILAAENLDPSFNPVLGRLLFTYKNINDVVTQGVELDGDLAIGRGASVGGAYTYLDARDTNTGRELTLRHRHQGYVKLGWAPARLGLRANVRGTLYSSWIAARGAQDTVAPGFSLWDAYVSQRLVRGLSAYVAIDNLADNQDPNTGLVLPSGVPAAIYRPEAGRTMRFGVRFNWAQR
jgi:outer membrane receptor for ferrienterochelin and colicins